MNEKTKGGLYMHKKSILLERTISLMAIIALIFINCAIVKASTIIEPGENQYLELKATSIKDVEGQNKQVIMELWGYDIDFKRIRC